MRQLRAIDGAPNNPARTLVRILREQALSKQNRLTDLMSLSSITALSLHRPSTSLARSVL
jgi:hypothetical protein